MPGVELSKEDGRVVVRCSECGKVMENTTKDVCRMMETGKMESVFASVLRYGDE
jgi:uncharacterized Zn finger protein